MSDRGKALELDRVSKSFGKGEGRTVALRDVSLEMRDGEFVSIVGPSGCGKSTVLRIVADLVSYAAGRLRFWLDLKLPISLPYVFTVLKLNVNLSLIGVIIAEFFGGRHGLGRQMKYAIEAFDMPTAWTTIVIAAVMGILWYHLVGGVERLFVPWDRSLRGQGD